MQPSGETQKSQKEREWLMKKERVKNSAVELWEGSDDSDAAAPFWKMLVSSYLHLD